MSYYGQSYEPTKVSLNVKLYSDEAMSILTAFVKSIKTIYNLRVQAWRAERWNGRYNQKPARPMMYDTFEMAIRDETGAVQLLSRQYGRNLYRFTNDPHLARTIGWAIMHLLPKAALGDIKVRAALKSEDIFQDKSGLDASHIACVAELLIGRDPKRLAKAYGSELVKSLVGRPDNLLVVQQRKTMLAEIDRLKHEMSVGMEKTRDDFNARIAVLNREREDAVKQIQAEYEAKINDLKNQLDHTMRPQGQQTPAQAEEAGK